MRSPSKALTRSSSSCASSSAPTAEGPRQVTSNVRRDKIRPSSLSCRLSPFTRHGFYEIPRKTLRAIRSLFSPRRLARLRAGEGRHAGQARTDDGRTVCRRIAFGETSTQRPAVVLRRRERRGVLQRRRSAVDLSVEARRSSVRSDLHDERGRLRRSHGLYREGPHDLFLFLPERQTHTLLLDAPRFRGLPAAARLLARLRVGHLP